MLQQLDGTVAEARQAAFIAAEQTDPEHYGQIIGKTINGRMSDTLVRMEQMAGGLLRASNKTQEVLGEAEKDRSDAQRQLLEHELKVDRFKSRVLWFGLGTVVLALALSVLLSRFYASNATTCAVLGASWTKTTSDIGACVFYVE